MEFILFFFCFIAKRVLHIGWNFIENLLGFFFGGGRNLATAQVQSWLEKRLVLDIFLFGGNLMDLKLIGF